MFYVIAADTVVLLHFLWVIFLITGAVFGRRYKWVKRLHIAGIASALTIQIFGWYCPLTYLEVWLRRMHDPSHGYSGSFIINYLDRILYINLPPDLIMVMTVVVAIISFWIYLRKPRQPVS